MEDPVLKISRAGNANDGTERKKAEKIETPGLPGTDRSVSGLAFVFSDLHAYVPSVPEIWHGSSSYV